MNAIPARRQRLHAGRRAGIFYVPEKVIFKKGQKH